jgi:hypothetical protein
MRDLLGVRTVPDKTFLSKEPSGCVDQFHTPQTLPSVIAKCQKLQGERHFMIIHVAQAVIAGVLCCSCVPSRAADLDEILLLHEASLERLTAIDAELVIKRVTKDAGTVDSRILCTWQEDFAHQLRRISVHCQ